jgi:competence protein ComEC
MSEALEKPKLFTDTKQFTHFVFVLACIIIVRLVSEYFTYSEFVSKPFYYTHAEVMDAYIKTKEEKRYWVLKLKSDEGYTFYTTSSVEYDETSLQHTRLRLQLFPNKSMRFVDYLGTFYIKSRIKKIEKLPASFKDTVLEKVAAQHQENVLASFYNGIFFATTIDRSIRDKINMLGISHVVSLSGFHLSILWAVIYGGLLLLYAVLQQRFFPYRHALFDVGLIGMVFLGVYVWFVDYPPALLRSYAMVLVGWMAVLLGMELLSFSFLATITLVLSALFPSMLVSLSFWLSVAGVFYIFLVLQYSKGVKLWVVSLLFMPLGIFVLMLPIVHPVFGVTSVYQLLSPFISMAFVPFYPLAIGLHLLGYGGVFDGALLWLFHLPKQSTEHLLPLWSLGVYVGLSLWAVWSKRAFYLLCTLALVYALFLFVFV